MKDILVVGDSWAAAREEDTGNDEGWPMFLGVTHTHRQGVSGSTAAQWANNTEGILKQAVDTPADIVVISLLGNDARHAMSDGVVTAEELSRGLRDLRTVVKALIRQLTIVMLYADPYCGSRVQSKVAVPLLNGAVQFACGGLPVVYAITQNWLKPRDFNGKGIHPIREGHRVIAKEIQELIELNAGLVKGS